MKESGLSFQFIELYALIMQYWCIITRGSISRRGAEIARAESGDGVLGKGQAAPSPPDKEVFCNTLGWGRGNF